MERKNVKTFIETRKRRLLVYLILLLLSLFFALSKHSAERVLATLLRAPTEVKYLVLHPGCYLDGGRWVKSPVSLVDQCDYEPTAQPFFVETESCRCSIDRCWNGSDCVLRGDLVE